MVLDVCPKLQKIKKIYLNQLKFQLIGQKDVR